MTEDIYTLAHTGAQTDSGVGNGLSVFGPGTALSSSDSFTSLSVGRYYATQATAQAMTGCPTSYSFGLYVLWRLSSQKCLVLFDASGKFFIKMQNGTSSWTSWKQITTTDVS